MFEALYERVLKPDEAFRRELLSLGFDMARMEPSYPLGVWEACVEQTVRREYPTLSPEEGARLLGRRFTEGFFETIIGRLAAVMLPLLAGRRYVERIPSFIHMGIPGAAVTVRWLAARHAVIELPGLSRAVVYVIQGNVEVGFQRTNQRGTVLARMTGARGGQLEVQWEG